MITYCTSQPDVVSEGLFLIPMAFQFSRSHGSLAPSWSSSVSFNHSVELSFPVSLYLFIYQRSFLGLLNGSFLPKVHGSWAVWFSHHLALSQIPQVRPQAPARLSSIQTPALSPRLPRPLLLWPAGYIQGFSPPLSLVNVLNSGNCSTYNHTFIIKDACVCVLNHFSHVLTLWPHGLYSPPGSSRHGILQARVLEWVAMPSSGGASQPGNWAHIS